MPYLRVFGAQVDGPDKIAYVVHRPRGHGRLVGRVGAGLLVGRRRGIRAGLLVGGGRGGGARRDARQRPVRSRDLTAAAAAAAAARRLFGRLCRFRRHASQPLVDAAVGQRGLFPGLVQRGQPKGRHAEERLGERARRVLPVAGHHAGRQPFARPLARARRRRRRQVQRVLLGRGRSRRRGATVVRVHRVVGGGRRRGRGTRPLRAAAAGFAAHERVELRRPDHGQQRLRGRHVHHWREHGHVGAGYGGRHERESRGQ